VAHRNAPVHDPVRFDKDEAGQRQGAANMKASTIGLCVLSTVLGASPVRAQTVDGSDNSRVRTGFEIAPVPLNLQGKNRGLVGLGSYLVNATGGCNDCHTSPPYAAGGDPFAGEAEIVNAARYLAGGTPFGPFVSRNLTPDENGLPAGLTFEQFRTTLRTGVDQDDPGRLLQVMPWPVFGKLSDRDLLAIYLYLSAIPSLPDTPAP
jgi:hypothetical protein